MAVPHDELKQKFPNIYLEPMQMENTEGKSHDTIPYMIVNLDYHDMVYIKKNTPVVYIHEEDLSCEYLEVNEIVESTQTGDSPPVCQKLYTLPLKHYSWVQQEIGTLEWAGVIKKSISPWASPIVVVPKKSAPSEPPRHRMCIDFRKLNELQPEVHHADSETGGNISLVPLPKIDEMYSRL